MKKMKLYLLTGLCICSLGATPLYTCAAETTETVVEEQTNDTIEAEDISDAEEEVTEDIPETEEESEIVTRTKKDETNTCQLSFKATIPEDFGLDCYIDLLHEDTQTTYRLIAYAKNNYTAWMYLPAGNYTVVSVGVWNDNTNMYPMELPDDFVLENEEKITLTSTLVNYRDVEAAIQKKIEEVEAEILGNEEVTEAKPLFEKEKEIILPWREIKHTAGKSNSIVTVSGTANDAYNVILEFTKSGTVKEAELKASFDGGETWYGPVVLKDTIKDEDFAVTKNPKTGLVFNFSGSETTSIPLFYAGDRYEMSTNKEYTVSQTSTGDAKVNIYTSEDLTLADYKVVVLIKSTGTTKDLTFDYSINGGFSYTNTPLTVPEGNVFQIPDTNVFVEFTDLTGQYFVNDKYTAKIPKDEFEEDHTYILIILGAIILVVVMGFLMFLKSTADKDSDFVLHKYDAFELEDQKNAKRPKKSKKK